MKTLLKIVGAVALFLVQIVMFALITALPTMWLWNAVMPKLFSLKHLGFLDALWLNLLCAFLFKSKSRSEK